MARANRTSVIAGKTSQAVVPAQAGIHNPQRLLLRTARANS
jgi:hypothetical protein